MFGNNVFIDDVVLVKTALLQRFKYDKNLEEGSGDDLLVRLSAAGLQFRHTGKYGILRQSHVSSVMECNPSEPSEPANAIRLIKQSHISKAAQATGRQTAKSSQPLQLDPISFEELGRYVGRAFGEVTPVAGPFKISELDKYTPFFAKGFELILPPDVENQGGYIEEAIIAYNQPIELDKLADLDLPSDPPWSITHKDKPQTQHSGYRPQIATPKKYVRFLVGPFKNFKAAAIGAQKLKDANVIPRFVHVQPTTNQPTIVTGTFPKNSQREHLAELKTLDIAEVKLMDQNGAEDEV